MEKICSFVINNRIYDIYDVKRIQGRASIIGRSTYGDGVILIEQNTPRQMMLTLKHELMHVWLYEHGHTNQNGQEIFNYEDLCELAALSNDFINSVVEKYLLNKYWFWFAFVIYMLIVKYIQLYISFS